MEAKDLRIGNYVHDRNGKLLLIHHWEHETKVSSKPPYLSENGLFGNPAFGHPLTEYIEYLKPIPLTEQWLLDFGFDKIDILFYTKWVGDMCYEYDTQSQTLAFGQLDDFSFSIDAKFVHQLQNLIFALTGKELTK